MFWWAGPDFAYSKTFRTILKTERPSILVVDSMYVDKVHDCHDALYGSALNSLAKNLLKADKGMRSAFESMAGGVPRTFMALWPDMPAITQLGTKDSASCFMDSVQPCLTMVVSCLGFCHAEYARGGPI